MDQPNSDRVTVSQAARVLGLNKSSVSRQVGKLGIDRDDQGRFSLAAYRAARGADLNPLMRRQPAAPAESTPTDGRPASDIADESDAPPEPARRPGLVSAQTAHKALQAKRLELEIAKEEGRLVERVEVRSAVMTASRLLRDAMLGLPSRLAGDLAGMTDAVEIRDLLDRHIRDHLATLTESLKPLTEQPHVA